jgi:hypothetical protein
MIESEVMCYGEYELINNILFLILMHEPLSIKACGKAASRRLKIGMVHSHLCCSQSN